MLVARTPGTLPPHTSCNPWAKNSTSRIPPRPILRSVTPAAPASARALVSIEATSTATRGSTVRRQTKGESASIRRDPNTMSPAIGRARRRAARSQVRPQVS